MKKSTLYLALLIGAVGMLALAPKLAAAECPMAGGSKSSCCGGLAVPMAAEVNTNATPSLLATCPVTGEKLGSMGKPFTFVYQEQEVKLCCKGCKKDFDKDPAKYMKLVRAADKK